MPTPEGLNTTVLHMKYVEPDALGTPNQGTLTFSPNPAFVYFPDENIIVAGGESVTLDVNGEATIELVSTDNAGSNPGPGQWLYTVTERIIGQKPRTYNISLNYTSGMVVELSDIIPVDTAPTYIPVVGPQGPPGVITTINGKSAAVVNLVAADLPDLIPMAQRAAANGVATLDATTKIPTAQLPDLSGTYILTSRINSASGVAGLTSGGLVGSGQLDLATSAPPSVGASAVGTATSLARSDHTHSGVDLSSAQSIAGVKTWTANQYITGAQLGVGISSGLLGRAHFRSAVNEVTLKLDNTATGATGPLLWLSGADTSLVLISGGLTSDTYDRFRIGVGGTISVGDGTNARDTTLSRSAANEFTMSGQLVLSGAAPTAAGHAARKDYVDTQIGTTVLKTGNQSIDGVKTFTSLPVIPTTAPTSSGQVASKSYVDSQLSLASMPGIFNVRSSPYNAVGNGTTNDAAAIQQALDAAHSAGGGIVLIPGGYTYAIGTFLVVYDKTTIMAYGATLKSIGNTGLLRNFLGSETFSGYAGHSNIRVYGGIWDGNAGDGTNSTTTAETDVLNFVHASNIVLRDLTVQNVSSAHGIEFNSIDGGVADNCRVLGFRDNSGTSARQYSEAIQIDIAVSGSSSIGNFDNTPCKNITVRDCYVGSSATNGAFGKLVGSHTTATGVTYDNINILNNTVDTTLDIGIRAYAWQNSEISGNRINNAAGYAISAEVAGTTATRGVKITDNVIENGSSGGITVIGASGATMTDVDVSRNNIKSCASAGLSINYADYPTIEGNNVDSSGGTGIFITNGTGGTISGNKVINSGSNCLNVNAQPSALVIGNTLVAPTANYIMNIESLTDVLIVGNYLYQPVNNKACINFTVSCNNCTATGNRLRAGSSSAYAVRSNATNGQSNNFINNDCKGFGNTAIYYGSSGQTSGFVWNTGSSGTPNGVVNLTWTNTANTGSNIV